MTPAILETTKALAGIANADRITEENKSKANDLLGKMLDILAKDVNETHKIEASNIIQPLPGMIGQA